MAAIFADYHLHSSFSADSDAPAEEQVRAAIKAGLTAACFTEHVDLDSPFLNAPDDDRLAFYIDEEKYLQAASALKEKYKDRIRLSFGVEMGLNHTMTAEVISYLQEHPQFDYVIGSTHSSRGMDPYYDSFFEPSSGSSHLNANERCDFDPYRIYFEDALKNLESLFQYKKEHGISERLIDSYAHLDYVLRCGPARADGSSPERTSAFYYEKYKDIIDEILLLLIREEVCLEVNTSPLKKGFPETNPGKAVLLRYKELGGELITIGSDAHAPEGIAFGFDQARNLLLACGFKYYAVFAGRVREMHHL